MSGVYIITSAPMWHHCTKKYNRNNNITEINAIMVRHLWTSRGADLSHNDSAIKLYHLI